MVKRAALIALLIFPLVGLSEQLMVKMFTVNDKGFGQEIGEVMLEDAEWGGVLIQPQLKDLPPGVHGFHLHAKGECGPAEQNGKMMPALLAGGHYDPDNTNKHEGPYGEGHLGDMPILVVDADGTATLPLYAPRLKAVDFRGRAVMIHAGGDNYADTPQPMGGGGARIACGIAKPLILCNHDGAAC